MTDYKIDEPAEWPNENADAIEERATLLRIAEEDAKSLFAHLLELAKSGAIAARTPAEVSNDLESQRIDAAYGEGWDDICQGLADTIAYAVRGDCLDVWLRAVTFAAAENYEDANVAIRWIETQMQGHDEKAWEYHVHERIG